MQVEGKATLLADSSVRTMGGLGVQCRAQWPQALVSTSVEWG